MVLTKSECGLLGGKGYFRQKDFHMWYGKRGRYESCVYGELRQIVYQKYKKEAMGYELYLGFTPRLHGSHFTSHAQFSHL